MTREMEIIELYKEIKTVQEILNKLTKKIDRLISFDTYIKDLTKKISISDEEYDRKIYVIN